MATHRSTWKKRETANARRFGAERQVGSGSGGRKDQTRSDSTHPRLFLEVKLRAASAVRTLWDQTSELARKESKVPVLALYAKHKPGALYVIHEKHLREVLAELIAAEEVINEQDGIRPEGEGLPGGTD